MFKLHQLRSGKRSCRVQSRLFCFLILQDGVNNNILTTEEKVIEKKQREPVSLAVTSPINDFRSSDGDDEFRVSQRRKIKSSSLRHQVPAVRYILIFQYRLVLIFQMLYPNVSSSFKIVLEAKWRLCTEK